MAYTPPDSKLVSLSFTGTYTQPDAKMVVIDLIPPPTGNAQILYPNAIGDYAVGSPTAMNKATILTVSGFVASAYGTPSAVLLSQGVSVVGSTCTVFGIPDKVWNYRTFAHPLSIEFGADEQTGRPTTRNQHEYLRPVGIPSAFVAGTVEMSHEDRGVHALQLVKAIPGMSGFDHIRTTRVAGQYVFVDCTATVFVSGASVILNPRDTSIPYGGQTNTNNWITRLDYPALTNPTHYNTHPNDTTSEPTAFVTDGTHIYRMRRETRQTTDYYDTYITKYGLDMDIVAALAIDSQYEGDALYMVAGRLFTTIRPTDRTHQYKIFELDKNTLTLVDDIPTVTDFELAPRYQVPDLATVSCEDDLLYILTDHSVTVYDPAQDIVVGSVTSSARFYRDIRKVGTQFWVTCQVYAGSYAQEALLGIYDSNLTLLTEQYYPEGPQTHAGRRLCVTANYVHGVADYFYGQHTLFDPATTTMLGTFPAGAVPPELVSSPTWDPPVPMPLAEHSVPVPRRLGLALSGGAGIPLTTEKPRPDRMWLFPAAAVLPNDTVLMSVASGIHRYFDVNGVETPMYFASFPAVLALTPHIGNNWTEVLPAVGIAPPTIPSPNARLSWWFDTLYPASASHLHISGPYIELKDRAVYPMTIDPISAGTPSLRNNLLQPIGTDQALTGIPDVSARQQFVYAAPIIETAIMGDPPRVWNYWTLVTPETVDHAYFQNFQPTVENRNKEFLPAGLSATRWGTAQLVNKAVGLQVDGSSTALYGTLEITNWYQHRDVSGADMSLFGTLYTANAQLAIRPAGWPFAALGEPTITNLRQYVTLAGIADPLQDSEPWTTYRIRGVSHIGAISSAQFSAPLIAHGIQYLLPTAMSSAVFGATRADLFRRALAPEGIFFVTPAAAFGTARLSPFVQTVALQGFGDVTFSLPDVMRNESALMAISAGKQTAFGDTQVDLYHRRMYPRAWGQYEGGEQTVWNWRTVVTTWSQSMPDVFGTPISELRNRLMQPLGYDLSRVSAYIDVSNKARLLPAQGDDLSIFGSSLVAPRIRTVRPNGDDLSRFGVWFSLHNRSQVVEVTGIGRPYAGVPTVWRNEQLTDNLGCGQTALFGDTLIAPRIRTITQYRYADPMAGFPKVDLHVQYIAPQGFAERFGWTFVDHFRNEARIFGSNYTRYGEPLIANFNPQAWVFGADMPDLPSEPWVSFRVRYISLAGQAVGEYQPTRPDVSFKTRTIAPRGYAMDMLPRTHEVRWDMPQATPHQTVETEGVMAPPFGQPFVGGTIVFPVTLDHARFGQVELTANSIWPSSELSYFSFVERPTITHRNRTIYPLTSQHPAVYSPERVFIFPAIVGPFADDDARAIMDAALVIGDDAFSRPFFGTPEVSNQHRAVAPYSRSQAALGMPLLTTNKVFPDGWNANEGKFGMTDFAGPLYINPYWGRTTEEYVPEIPTYNFDTALYGRPEVDYPYIPPVWSPYINAVGTDMQTYGRTFVESSIRNIYPEGIDANKEFDQVSWVWLHPPFHLYPDGVQAPEITITQIAYRIRSVYPEGDDYSVVCLEDASDIALRMRVHHGMSRCVVGAITPETITITQVAYRIRGITTNGADSSMVSAGRALAQNTVVPTSTDSAVLGIPRRAVFGELYPYAPDMQLHGYPKINRRATVQTIAPDSMTSPRVGRPIRPGGWDSAGYEPPAATNIYGCRNRVVIVAGQTDFASFGGTHVTH